MIFYQGTYQDYISADDEVKQLLHNINRLVEENSEECKVTITFLYSLNKMINTNQTCLTGNLYIAKEITVYKGHSHFLPLMNSAYNLKLYIKGNCSQRAHFQVPLGALYTQV